MVATNDICAEVATLLSGPAWSGQRVVELGSMVSADEVAEQLGDVLTPDVKAFAVPRAGWAVVFEVRHPEGNTGPAEEMSEAANAGWTDLGAEDTEHAAGTTSARDVFEAAQNAARYPRLFIHSGPAALGQDAPEADVGSLSKADFHRADPLRP